jgi:uroporphyrinogen-III decarboxylase
MMKLQVRDHSLDVLQEQQHVRRCMEDAAVECGSGGGRRGHVLNLGHGVTIDTPEDAVQQFVNAAKN